MMEFIRCIVLDFSTFGLLNCVRYNRDLIILGIVIKVLFHALYCNLSRAENIESRTALYKGIRCNDVYSQPRRREFIESSSSNKARDTSSLEKST